MQRFFKRIDEWFLFSSPLSKTGVVFLLLSALLTLISFVKGIQVLMFVPAFILSLFFFSLWDYWIGTQKISLVKNKKERVCTLYFPKGLDGYFFRIAVQKDGEWTFLPVEKRGTCWKIPEDTQKIQIIYSGRLDIFKKSVSLPLNSKTFSVEEKISGNDDILLEISEYEAGDELSNIDSKRTALSEKIFVRKKTLISSDQQTRALEKNLLEMTCTQEISGFTSHGMLQKGLLGEWFLIFLGFVGVMLQWGGILFPVFFLGSVLFIWKQEREKKTLSQKYLNPVALILFFGSLAEGFLTLNTVLSGAHFLLLLSVWKHGFLRERRDGFTYIFLVLFVFIALSLYTLSAWFLFLFLSFLVLSGFLFTVFSGGEVPEEYSCRCGTRYSTSFFVKYFSVLLLGTFFFFLVLPHGDSAKNTTSLISAKSQAQTGFTESVNLNSVGSIKQNFSKKIVIENADISKVWFYQDMYWRGARFNEFDGFAWKKVEKERSPFIPSSLASSFIPLDEREKITLKIYSEGGKNIFLPTPPLSLRIPGTRVFSVSADKTIFELSEASPTALFLEVAFALDEKGQWISGQEKSSETPLHCRNETCVFSEEVEKTFTPFWNSIPKSIHAHPEKISDYIQKKFSYSLEAPAKNMEDFLYGIQQGHCEYFASTLAVTLQHFGFSQATLVNGFHGGEWNEQAGAWVVRNQNAHSWVEIYSDEEKKWITLDPTPSSSGGLDQKWFQKNLVSTFMIELYDAIEIKWNRFFVEFTGTKQKEFFLWIFSFWNYFLAGFSLFFGTKYGYRYYRDVYAPFQKMSPQEQFSSFLKTTIFQNKSLTEISEYQESYPELVSETQKFLYAESGKKGEVQETISHLKKKWKEVKKSL